VIRTMLALVVWCAVASGMPTKTAMAPALAPTVVATALAQPVDIDIDLNNDEWYEEPVWIAIGGLAVVLLIVVLVIAFRGGGRVRN
jgi:hypothetical protein